MCEPYGLFHDYVAIWLSNTLFLRLMRKHFHGNLRYLNYRSYLYRSFAVIRDHMEFWVGMWDFGCTTLIFVWGTLRFHKSAFRCTSWLPYRRGSSVAVQRRQREKPRRVIQKTLKESCRKLQRSRLLCANKLVEKTIILPVETNDKFTGTA